MKRSVFITLSVVAFLGISLLSRCYYDSEEYLYGAIACDTTNVTYSGTIAPILSNNCNSCHSGGTPSGGVRTDTYEGVSVIAASGRLYGATNEGTMPPSGKMDDCTIGKIKAWVDAGAPNN